MKIQVFFYERLPVLRDTAASVVAASLCTMLLPGLLQAAPNDFDGDGRSDFTVARYSYPSAPCAEAPPWANCTSNLGLLQVTWFSKSSATGDTKIRSLVTPHHRAGASRMSIDAMSMDTSTGEEAVPRLIRYRSYSVGARANLDYDIEYVYQRSDGSYSSNSRPKEIETRMLSNEELIAHFGSDYKQSILHLQDFRYFVTSGPETQAVRDLVQVTHIYGYNDGSTALVFNLPSDPYSGDIEMFAGLPTERFVMESGTPVIEDFNSDGVDEIGVFNSRTGHWRIRELTTGEEQYIQWGLPGDKPVPGDYDGDGAADIAVFRPSNAVWYILTSSTGFAKESAIVSQFGLPPYFSPHPSGFGDIRLSDYPVKGDFDGDGKLDLAVFRMSNGSWYYRASSSGAIIATQWGVTSDHPVGVDALTRMWLSE